MKVICHPAWVFIASYIIAFALGVLFQCVLAGIQRAWRDT